MLFVQMYIRGRAKSSQGSPAMSFIISLCLINSQLSNQYKQLEGESPRRLIAEFDNVLVNQETITISGRNFFYSKAAIRRGDF